MSTGAGPVHIHHCFDAITGQRIRLSVGETPHPDVTHWYDDDPDTAYCGKDISDEPFTEEKPDEITCGGCYSAWLETDPIIEFD